MDIRQRIYCLFGRHHRDRRHARHDGFHFHSRCTGCGKPMVRDQRGWHLAEDEPPAPDS